MYRQKTLMVNSEQKELIDNKDISTVSVNVGGYMGTESSWNHVNDISLEEKGRSLFLKVILSRLVDTFFSRISLTMPLPPKFHNTAYVLLWEEDLHWQSRSSGCSSS